MIQSTPFIDRFKIYKSNYSTVVKMWIKHVWLNSILFKSNGHIQGSLSTHSRIPSHSYMHINLWVSNFDWSSWIFQHSPVTIKISIKWNHKTSMELLSILQPSPFWNKSKKFSIPLTFWMIKLLCDTQHQIIAYNAKFGSLPDSDSSLNPHKSYHALPTNIT